MAPGLAVARLRRLPAGSVVLDPMSGSGTVIRHALDIGHRAVGIDIDPLAVLMGKVWTNQVEDDAIADLTQVVLDEAKSLDPEGAPLPWIDDDPETSKFVEFWFGAAQRDDLRRLAHVLWKHSLSSGATKQGAEVDVLRIALSRLIIVKENGASLARDISHSRPHKVAERSDFHVLPAFERSVRSVRRRLSEAPLKSSGEVTLGDARFLTNVGDSEVDAVMTSPPYLNAIDYTRGHRLSLVWLGYSLPTLRRIRTTSVGAERGLDHEAASRPSQNICDEIVASGSLPGSYKSMVLRYAEDLYRIMSELVRVLKPTGRVILVVGNSCLQGTFVRNSAGVIRAASLVGLRLVHKTERDLPVGSRYLPMPKDHRNPLGRRMRTETVLTFRPA
jgi:SAM-dependent methyltransferase